MVREIKPRRKVKNKFFHYILMHVMPLDIKICILLVLL
jgi:hypothetical protein